MLKDIDGQILDGMTESTAEELAVELDSAGAYTNQFIELREAFESLVVSTSAPGTSNNVPVDKGCLKLQKQTLVEFDGEVKNSLGFWSQFKNVHEDDRLSPITKFSYLRQAMTPGSPAAAVVHSYVQSEESYPSRGSRETVY